MGGVGAQTSVNNYAKNMLCFQTTMLEASHDFINKIIIFFSNRLQSTELLFFNDVACWLLEVTFEDLDIFCPVSFFFFSEILQSTW